MIRINRHFSLLVPNTVDTFVSLRDPEVSLRRLATFGASCILLLVFLSGCATLTAREPSQAYYLRGAKYYALDDLCQLNGIDWSWDYLSEVATLKRGKHQIKLMPESEIVLVDNKAINLQNPVIIENSRLLVPLSFKSLIIDKIF